MIALTQQNDSNMINDRKNKTEIYVCDSDKHTHTLTNIWCGLHEK